MSTFLKITANSGANARLHSHHMYDVMEIKGKILQTEMSVKNILTSDFFNPPIATWLDCMY